ncbi:MAG TPA: HAD family hydrolase [Pseudomonadales bacterium]
MADIKLVTFDLDNTLWNVETVIRNAERRMREWLHERAPEFHVRFPPEAIMALRNAVIEELPELRHDLSTLREEILYRALQDCGFGRRDARALAKGAFEIFLAARHEVEFFDGALEALETLAARYRLGALTNGNADIGRLKLDRYFDFGFTAASVGVGKPAPDMFRAALEHARVTPREAVHVGDHLTDDVEGASGVGMHTIWVNHAGLELPAGAIPPTEIVQSLTEIPTGVERIAER